MDRSNGRGPVAQIEPHPEGSVVVEPPIGMAGAPSDFVLWIASAADSLPTWGSNPAARDNALRRLWVTEPILAGAVFTMVSRYAAFGYRLEGPDRMVKIYDEMLNCAQFGKGWLDYIILTALDYLTQDNGAFTEIVRIDNNDPTSPVITFNHLDAARCIRTGRIKEPVIYTDRWGRMHLLKWWQVADLTEMPSPIESMRGMQYCAITRLLRSAQIARDESIYTHEKVSGRFNRGMHLVGGIQSKVINDVLAQQRANNDAMGLTHFTLPAIVAAVDPTAKVSHEFLELASLPEGYDVEKEFSKYITTLALAFGTDYQEFAPLKSTGMGGGSAGEMLHLKGRGKGPKLFMSKVETMLNWHGFLPRNITFVYGDQDSGEQLDRTKHALLRAEERAMRIKSGELTPEIAVQLAVDDGDLKPELAAELLAAIEEQKKKDEEMQKQEMDMKKQQVENKLETAKDGMMKSPRAPQVDRGSA